MNRIFIVKPTKRFSKILVKLYKKDRRLALKVIDVVEMIKIDPFHPTLRSHKVTAKIKNSVYSSRVTGDIRIIWEFRGEDIIVTLDLGGHDEVY